MSGKLGLHPYIANPRFFYLFPCFLTSGKVEMELCCPSLCCYELCPIYYSLYFQVSISCCLVHIYVWRYLLLVHVYVSNCYCPVLLSYLFWK